MRSFIGAFWLKCLVSALSVAAWASIADARNRPTADANVQNKQDMVAETQAAAESIVTREEAAAGRAFDPAFRAEALRKLASLTPSELQSIQSQSGAGLGIVPKAFGSSQADLVYTPVTPCRIIDTRVAGGAITAGSQRSFLAAGGPFTGQGGSSGNCGVPFGPATAAVINFVAVNAAGAGDLRITPFGTPIPLASIINYAAVPGLNIANGPAVTICNPATTSCGADFTIQADVSATDLVADIQGYFSLLPSTLASGKTLRGVWGKGFSNGSSGPVVSTFAFPIELASAPTPNFIPAGGTPTTACPGSPANPTATPGNLCVYETMGTNRTFVCIAQPSGVIISVPPIIFLPPCGTDTFGADVIVTATTPGQFYSYGTWAVTAP